MLENEHEKTSRGPSLHFHLSATNLQRLVALFIMINLIAAFAFHFIASEMYPFFMVFFLWSALYIILLAICIRLVQNTGSVHYSFILLLLVTLIPRVFVLLSDAMISLDTLWYLDFGKFMLRGDMPYADFYFPYPPFFAYFILFISLIAPYSISFKILSIFFDILIVFVLSRIVRNMSDRPELSILPIAYALFPLTIIESALNGHFEPVANLLFILAIWLLFKNDYTKSSVLLGLSAATKVYAGLVMPFVIFLIPEWKQRARYFIIVIATFVLTFIPFSIPVWLRGDLLFPGTAMPGFHSNGFFDSMFGYLTRLDPFRRSAVMSIGILLLVAITIFLYRRTKSNRPSTRPITYDILVVALAILFIVMAFTAAAYPFTRAAFNVYWRYPSDVAIVRGITTISASMLILVIVMKRWRLRANRKVLSTHKTLLFSTGILLLMTVSRNVFYGWYLLWAIPTLFFMRDRRILFTILVCMLLLYPSYTHDNFTNLGYSEEKTWREDFVGVESWDMQVILPSSGIAPDEINATLSSNHGIGEFYVDASRVSNATALKQVMIIWSRDAQFPVTSRTEFVDYVSASWDPTFGRLGEFAVLFEGLNATGHQVTGTLNWPSWSPSNLTYVLWRYAFSKLPSRNRTVEVTKIFVIASSLTPNEMIFYVDIMYTTEYYVITPASIPSILLLAIPNMAALIIFHRALGRDDDHTLL